MSRYFIAAVVASSIALTSLTATPSFAGSRDRDKALLGIAAFLLLGSALADADRKKSGSRHVTVPEPVKPRPLPPRIARYNLPAKCLKSAETRRGEVRFFGRGCLRKNFRYANALPRQCARQIKTWGKVRNGYAPRCLRKHGYRVRRG